MKELITWNVDKNPTKNDWYLVTIRGDLWGEPTEYAVQLAEFKNGHWVEWIDSDGEDIIDGSVQSWTEIPKGFVKEE